MDRIWSDWLAARICESDRLTRGVLDNRRYAYWIDDDLAARTVADREAFYKKHLGKSLEEFTKYDDRVRLLIDTDDDLKMDQSFIFAEGFNGLVQGAGAGVLAIGAEVYYTCTNCHATYAVETLRPTDDRVN